MNRLQQVSLVAAASTVVFAASLGFFMLFFRHFYHGDLALPITLAGAIHDTGQLFPTDFFYGNDLIFLRPQFLTAITLRVISDSYTAYALACSTSITLCFLALTFAFRALGGSELIKSLLLAALLLLPLGYTEHEFMIGQQSHLLSVTLSLISVIAAYAVSQRASNLWPYIVLAACLMLVTIDSPPRGAILLASIFGVIGLLSVQTTNPRRMLGAGAFGLAGVVIGVVLNKLIGIQPIGIGNDLIFDIDNSLIRFGEQIKIFINRYIGLDALQNQPILSSAVVVFGTKLLALAALIIAMIVVTRMILSTLLSRDTPPSLWLSLGMAGMVSIALGLVMVSYSRLNIDVRHYLFGLVAIKAATVVFIARYKLPSLVAALMVVCLASTVTLFAVSPGYQQRYLPRTERMQAILGAIKETIEEAKLPTPVTLYGDFHNSLPYEFFAPDLVAGAPASVHGEKLRQYSWLSRPTRYCKDEPALYAQWNDDHKLEAELKEHGLAPVREVAGLYLYIVPGKILADCS